MGKDKSLEHIKKVCGGGEDADFVKHPPTEEEISACIKRLGCLSLEELAFHRRRLNIRKLQK